MVRWKSTMLAATLGLLACTPGAHAAITFADAVEYPAPTFPWTVALGDLNEDTKPDIVLTSIGSGPNQDDGKVSVLLNRGDGTFDPAVSYPACPSAHGAAVGDFDGDQNLDVVAACRLGALATFTGNGDGTLDLVDLQSGLLAGTFIGAAQLNGAGSHELVYTSLAFSPAKPTMCRTSYNGTDWAATSPCSDPNGPNPAFGGGPIVPADFTDDGGDEILNGSDAGNGVRSFRPAPGSEWSWEDRSTGDTATAEYVATDLQADGDVDVVAAGTDPQNNGRLAVLLSQFAGGSLFGGIGASQQVVPYPSVYPEEAGAGDFDGDGLNDVMVLSSIDDNADGSGDGLGFHGNTDGTLAASETFKHPFNGSRLTLATGDLNGDGRADAVICGTAGTQPNLHDACAVEIATGSAPPVGPGEPGRPPPEPPLIVRLFDTVITSGPDGVTGSWPTFTFETAIGGATFECRFDDREFRPCTSPHTGYNLARGPHTFEVRYVDLEGTRDPTPASRSFTLGTETRTGSCTIQIEWDGRSQSCVALADTCPTGSRCTLTGSVDVTSEDMNAWYDGYIRLSFGGATKQGPDATSAACTGPDVRPGGALNTIFYPVCPQRTSPLQHYGSDDSVEARCQTSQGPLDTSVRAKRGPDEARRATCQATLRIEPAASFTLKPPAGTSTGLFVPGGGTLTVTGTARAGARAAGARRPRTRAAIARVRKRAVKAGPINFQMKPTAAVQRQLRRRRPVKMKMRVTFVAADGTRTVKTQNLTVRPLKTLPRLPRRRRP